MMKIYKKILFLICLILSCSFVSLAAQEQRFSINVKNIDLEEFFFTLEKQTPYKFSYRNIILNKNKDITLKMENASIKEILNRVLPSKGLDFNFVSENSIAIIPLSSKSEPIKKESIKKKITGVVVDEKGEPIIGANILLKGTNIGTITDFNGNFSLEVPSDGILTITYLGYEPQTIEIGGRTTFKIILKEETKLLEEIVVVGYGTQKKVNLTGAVSMITSEELNSRPITNVSSGLQGLLSGVTVVNTSGQPGVNSTNIRIRGLGTIGNANPLVLIDGVEGDMNLLNPEDIQSISVLKDAASSSIYGARAANGVILVTTKKLTAKDQPPTISLNAYYGIQKPTRLPEMCNAIEFMMLDNEARANVGTAIAWNESHFEKVRNNSDPNYFGNTDWISAVLNNNAPQQNYSVNINGNIGQSGYLLSYRYLDQQGLTVGNTTGEKRHNLRFKVNSKLLNRVEINTNIGYTLQNIIAPAGSSTTTAGTISALYNAMRIAPNVPIYYTDGSWAYGGGNTNPVAILHDGGKTTYDADELSLMCVAKIDLMKGWDVSATYSIVNKNALTNSLRKKIIFTNPDEPETPAYVYNDPNILNVEDLRRSQQTLIVQSNFEFDIQKHKISGVGGFLKNGLNQRALELQELIY